jgi:hypothetical protein
VLPLKGLGTSNVLAGSDNMVWIKTSTGAPQLAGINVDESTAEAIADWDYWVTQGYHF